MNAAEKGVYEHFMLKEMHEQPKAVKDTLTPRIKNGDVVIEELGMTDEEIRAISKIFIVATAISGPAQVYMTLSASLAIELPTVILRQNTSFSSDAASTMQSRWRAP